MIIEVSLKENLKNKKIIKVNNDINTEELLKILSNKFNTKIISIETQLLLYIRICHKKN